MDISVKFLAMVLLTLAISGCSSTPKKSCASASQNAPVSTVAAVEPAAAPVAEPVADEVPAATRQYVNK